MPESTICSFEPCDKPRARMNGLCGSHHKQQYLGKPLTPLRKVKSNKDPVTTFWSKVDKSGDCWLWTGAIKPNGYGVFPVYGRTQHVHRLVFQFSGRDLSADEIVDHSCWNRACVNPEHLRVTNKVGNGQNLSRGARNPKSTYRNVECNQGSTYCVRLTIDGRRTYLGNYATAEEANEVAVAARKRYYPHSQW